MSKDFFNVGITLDGYIAGLNGGPKNRYEIMELKYILGCSNKKVFRAFKI